MDKSDSSKFVIIENKDGYLTIGVRHPDIDDEIQEEIRQLILSWDEEAE